MDILTYIPKQLAHAHGEVKTVMKDLTEEQYNWLPPGRLNPISAVLVHIFSGEDFFIQAILQGKSRLWEAQDWGKQIGVPMPPGPGRGWEIFRTKSLSLAPVLEYGKAVHTATQVYLGALSEAELDRQVDFVGRMVPVADMLILLADHIACHAGEIAALKGMQGVQGLPF